MTPTERRILFVTEEQMKCGQKITEFEFEKAKAILEKQIKYHLEEIKIAEKRIEFLKNNTGGSDVSNT